jgi:hypothetical protein
MKLRALLAAILLAAAAPNCGLAQSSTDHWDGLFHPSAVQHRKQKRFEAWINSWRDRLCRPQDVKTYWSITLRQPAPNPLDQNYRAVQEHNAKLDSILANGNCDFEAQDIADQLNIEMYRHKGMEAQARAIELTRAERIRLREQREFQERLLAQQKAAQQQFAREIAALRQEVYEAREAADDARAARAR